MWKNTNCSPPYCFVLDLICLAVNFLFVSNHTGIITCVSTTSWGCESQVKGNISLQSQINDVSLRSKSYTTSNLRISSCLVSHSRYRLCEYVLCLIYVLQCVIQFVHLFILGSPLETSKNRYWMNILHVGILFDFIVLSYRLMLWIAGLIEHIFFLLISCIPYEYIWIQKKGNKIFFH